MEGFSLLVAVTVVVALVAIVMFAIRRARAAEERLAEIDTATRPYAEGTDVTERIRTITATTEAARAERDETRREQAQLIELIGVGVVRLDRRRRIVLANTAAHAFLDRAPGTLVGMTATAAFLDARVEAVVDTADRTGAASDEVLLTGTQARLTVRARRASGGGLWVLLEDVSELRRLQQIRTEFIDNLSHELRTPLTTVSLLAETLAREATIAGDAIPARMRERIDTMGIETGHLATMVDELLDLSRIESGGSLVLLDDVDLVGLARASIERLRLFADRQGVRLEVVDDGAVPPIRGDASRLGQVLVNLLHNAIKFSPDGGLVTVTVRRDGETVLTTVADHGIGIPAGARDRVFERFYKADRARSRGAVGGTGLGLAIARHIVEQHGGTISVTSDEGVGSIFAFAIPIATEAGLG